MEIVVKIPDKEYERLVYQDVLKLRSYIENGAVLPKGHGKLIDADALYNDYINEPEEFSGGCSFIGLFRSSPVLVEADKENKKQDADSNWLKYRLHDYHV